MMYTTEGEELMAQLWNETLAEQEQFGVEEALEAIAGQYKIAP